MNETKFFASQFSVLFWSSNIVVGVVKAAADIA